MNMLEKANEQYDDLVKKKEIVENDKVSGIVVCLYGLDPGFTSFWKIIRIFFWKVQIRFSKASKLFTIFIIKV